MLPSYVSPTRRRRPGAALINLGAMRRRMGENPRVMKFGLPALALFLVGMVATSVFSEAERLPKTENKGLDQAGNPTAHPTADRVAYTHQSQDLEDWAVKAPPSPAALPGAAAVAAAAVASAATAVVTPAPPVAEVVGTSVDGIPEGAAHADGVVDTSTLVDDHPWLVEAGETVAEDLDADAHALASAEQKWVAQPLNAEAVKLAAEEQELVKSTETALVAEEKAVIADTALVESKVEGVLEEAQQAVAPLENEVTTVVKAVEQEAGVVEAHLEVSGAAAAHGAAAEIEVVESAAEEEVIVIVGTMEEMLFSWTFFGVFLFSLYRVSRKERKWWRDSGGGSPSRSGGGGGYSHRGGDDDDEEEPLGPYAPRHPRAKLLTPRPSDRRAGAGAGGASPGSAGPGRSLGLGGGAGSSPGGVSALSSSLFLDDDDGESNAADDLNEDDRAALELGRLMLQEREAADRMREQTAQAKAAQEAFSAFDAASDRPEQPVW